MTRALVFAAIALTAAVADAQEPRPGSVTVQAGVEPERVTVGEPFTISIRVAAPPGVQVEFAPFAGSDSIQAVSPPAVVGGAGATTARYRLVAWIPEAPLEATLPLRLVEADGRARVHLVRLPLPEVTSVLPDDASAIEPRPARGYVPVPGTLWTLPWWYWALALLGALIAGAVGLLHLRRRETDGERAHVPPREWALSRLDGIHPDPAAAEAYRQGAWILRRFLTRTDPRFGPELTSAELVWEVSAAGIGTDAADGLKEILAAADTVKFSGSSPGPSTAADWLRAVRDWIAANPPASGKAAGASHRAA